MGRDRAGEADKQRLLVTPILRLVSSLTSLVDSSEFLEVYTLSTMSCDLLLYLISSLALLSIFLNVSLLMMNLLADLCQITIMNQAGSA